MYASSHQYMRPEFASVSKRPGTGSYEERRNNHIAKTYDNDPKDNDDDDEVPDEDVEAEADKAAEAATGEPGQDNDEAEFAAFRAQQAAEGKGPKLKIHKDKSPSEIQLIDLHTKQPLVAWNGKIYDCKWADNIGSELLFIRHEADSDLPVLRNLPGDMDLLASSSTRIVGTPLSLEARAMARPKLSDILAAPVKGRQPNSLRATAKDFKIYVPDASSNARKDQGEFLSRLAAVKHARGEEDKITLIAQSRVRNTGWRSAVDVQRGREKVALRKEYRHPDTPDERKHEILERLREMKEEDEESRLRMKRKKRKHEREGDVQEPEYTGLPSTIRRELGRPKRRPRLAAGGMSVFDHVFSSDSRKGPLSVPTPEKWSDIEGDEDGEDEEEDDMDDEGSEEEDSEEDDGDQRSSDIEEDSEDNSDEASSPRSGEMMTDDDGGGYDDEEDESELDDEDEDPMMLD